MPTSFHCKLGQYLVERELKELAEQKANHPLGVDPNGETITWKMLLDPNFSGPPSFFPNVLSRRPSPLSLGLPVAIVGGGVAGLRVAMLLERSKTPYKLFEASERLGGRTFTYHFKRGEGESQTIQNYFDVGAMRFPDNAINATLFELFKELDITDAGGTGGKLLPYQLSASDDVLLFNGISKSAGEVNQNPGADHFNDGTQKGGRVPEEYINKEYTKPNGTKLHGVSACLEAAFGPFKEVLARNWEEGWERLMEQDHRSTRSYMIEVMKYPWAVVQWMERNESGTSGFDQMGFTESVLESLEFDYPTGVLGEDKAMEWRCIEGGAETLINAMYASLENKADVLTGQRVISIEKIRFSPLGDTDEIRVAGHTIKCPAEIKDVDYPITVMAVTVEGASPMIFSHVVPTVPFGALRGIDLGEVGLDYDQEMALRSMHYAPAVKVGIKFKSRWWQDSGHSKTGGSSKTDRQSRVVIYPDYGLEDEWNAPGVLMATYNWKQDAFRYGALIEAKDWNKVLDPKRERPGSERLLLRHIFTDLSKLHGRDPSWYEEQMIDYYAYNWYQNPFTMGAYASFGPGQFSNLYPTIAKPASDGYLHFGGEVASYHHGWVSGALDSAWRCVWEIEGKDGTPEQRDLFREKYGGRREFENLATATAQYYRGIYANSLEKPEGNKGEFEF